jgi:hypothetical protein
MAGDFSITLTVERLREVLDYDPATGVFTWLIATSRRVRIGSVAGTVDPRGYRHINVDGHRYYAHRLAWFYVYGEWPAGILDHEDQVPGHDWFKNLRPATQSKNLANSRRKTDSLSGFKGVAYVPRLSRWQARVAINGKRFYIGSFATPEEAHAAYMAKARELYGEFANDGQESG